MNSLKKFRSSLYRLCSGDYSHQDVQTVVAAITHQARRFLFHREKKQYQYRGQWANGSTEINDIALDLIAHLFARDETGHFVELEKYFSETRELSDEDFKETVFQLLNSVIQQQSIRLFKERDPFGKAFYRSLRYLQNKHTHWMRTFVDGRLVFALDGENQQIMSPDTMVQVIKQSLEGQAPLTEQLEQVLSEVIDNRQQALSVEDLLSHMRVLAQLTLEGITPETSPAVDSFIYNIIEVHIKKTVEEIDQSILYRYEADGKLSPAERKGFRESIRPILTDHADGGCQDNYYTYLAECLDSLDDQETYKSAYRTQFEYIAKKAKSVFSAKVESALRIK
ncbi:MAG: hypothetical protein MAGBODY4_00404 [Candidatus Marinimicrobia bacterium]|nr:hypothetical protein [Candidatus Neomarinimicrobiota bacterium]